MLLSLDSNKAYTEIKKKLETLNTPSYAMVLYLAALYDISLDKTYLDEIRNMRIQEDWILSNKINQVLKDRDIR